MRIGLVLEHFDPLRGGAETWTFQLARRLVARGHEVHVAAAHFAAAAMSLPFHAIELPKTRSRLAFAAAAESQLRPLNLDIVHDMGAGWYGDVFLSHDGSRTAQWEHKLALLPFWARPTKRLMLNILPRYTEFRRLAARQYAAPGRIFIAMSRMTAEDYTRYHGVPPEQIRLIYHGVDVQAFSPEACRPHREAARRGLGVEAGETLFTFVGHDYVRKGLGTAIRATARLVVAGQTVKLAVVGGRRGAAAYANLARQLGADDAVRFVGSQGDPLPFYAASDAVVLPTFYDPFGLVVLEAAACGLPTITSRAAGANELITEGADGFAIDDPRDDAMLAERMGRLLDPMLRRRMGEAAREMALAHPFDRNADEILAVYEEVVARKRAGRAAA